MRNLNSESQNTVHTPGVLVACWLNSRCPVPILGILVSATQPWTPENLNISRSAVFQAHAFLYEIEMSISNTLADTALAGTYIKMNIQS